MDLKGLFGIREADGSISLSDVVIPSMKPDGKKHREGFFVSKESAEKFIERSRARGEKTTEMSCAERNYLRRLLHADTTVCFHHGGSPK